MKRFSSFQTITSSTAIIIALSFTSCKKDLMLASSNTNLSPGGTIVTNPGGKIFDVKRFKSNLQATIPASVRGYSFVITSNRVVAESGARGNATTTIAWTTNQEVNIASVSKTMTAVAVMQLLKKNGKNLGSTIGEYLPAKWNPTNAIRNLTFEELLSHSSGLSKSNTSWDTLQATIRGPLDNPSKPTDVYSNMNFAIFRVIIPYMNNKNACLSMEAGINSATFENWLSDQYIKYMQDNIFTPIGLANVNCTPLTNTAMMYSEPINNQVGFAAATPGDWKQFCGGGGFYMSTVEIARFMVYLTHTNLLLDQTQRTEMDSKFLGWDNEDSPSTVAGRAFGKDGALFSDLNQNDTLDNNEPGLQTLVMKFPNKVEIAFAANSIQGQFRGYTNIVRGAYNAAWINP
jgi:D-alanyl-D-alanine carboxypeptidase